MMINNLNTSHNIWTVYNRELEMANMTLLASEHEIVDVSLVIPLYNEHDSLKLLHEKIVTSLEALDLVWEVIYVDDGSNDGSLSVLKELQQSDEHVLVAVQRRNFGKSLALAAGFALTSGQILITMDADLQDEPAEIPRLLAKLDEGYDVVIGWREQREDDISKRLPSWIANTTTRLLTGLQIRDMNTGLKAYRRDCIDQIALYGDMHRYIPILAHFMGFKVTEIPVVHHKRQFGYSKYRAGRFIRGGLDLITVLFLNKYGRRPLHLFGLLGGILLMVGLLVNFDLSIQWLQGLRPIGTRPALLFGILLTLMGIQILSVGLVAELLVAFIQKSENPLHTLSSIYRAKKT